MTTDVFLQLRWKLSLSILLVLSLVLLTIIGSFNLYLIATNKQEASHFIDEIELNNGRLGILDKRFSEDFSFEKHGVKPPPKPMNPEKKSILIDFLENFYPFRASFVGFRNFFTAYIDSNGKIQEIVSPFYGTMGEQMEKQLVNYIVSTEKANGLYRGFSWRIHSYEDEKRLLIILDRANELNQEKRFVLASLLLFIFSLGIMFGLTLLFTRWASRPIQEAFYAQKQFIADASHELKTPIAVIGANIDVLEQDSQFSRNKWLGYIKTENARMGTLVKDMLYLAKDDAGKLEYDRIPFDFCDAIARSVLPFESVAFEDGKKLQMNLPKQIIYVVGDEEKIRQVVIILVDNALKNSENGALIRVSIAQEGAKCYLKVYNTGMGISPLDQKKIFNRFYRADSSRARTTGGYGLGLSIAQSIVFAHHGKISVESEEGKYAEFTICLPCAEKI